MFKARLPDVFLRSILCASFGLPIIFVHGAVGQELQSQQAKLDNTSVGSKAPAFATPPSYLKSLRKSTDTEIEDSKRSRLLVNKSFGAEEIRPPETIDHGSGRQTGLPSEFFGQPNGLLPTYKDPAGLNGVPSARTAHTNFAFSAIEPAEAPLQGGAVRGRTVNLEKLYGHQQMEVNDPRLKLLELQQISKSRFEPPGTTPIEAY